MRADLPTIMTTHDYFSRWSTDLYGSGTEFQRTIHALTAGIVQGDTLDLGCGSRVHYCTANAQRWVGMDLSQAMLDDLRFFGQPPRQPPEKIAASCFEAPFQDQSFDTVCAMFLLHHLGQYSARCSRRRVVQVLATAHRLLRPGGQLLIAESARRALELPYHALFPALYRIFRLAGIELPYFWTLRQLLAMSRTAGFADSLVARIPIRERIVNPVSGIALPPLLTNLLQHMTLIVLTKH